MPALLMHLSLVKEAAARVDLPAPLAGPLAEERGALLLGAVLPDLPYHARFGMQLLRHLLRRDYLPSEWGDILHTRGTGRLALGMLEHIGRAQLLPPERAAVLALAAGYLSHHTVDRLIHPLIHTLVDRHRTPGEPAQVVHARVERYQNVCFHLDRQGRQIFATDFPRQLVAEMAGARLLRPTLSPPLWHAFRAATIETHGRAPAPRAVREWLWGIAAYAHLVSSASGRLERPSGDLAPLRSQYYQGPEVDLPALIEQAQAATVAAWGAALEVLSADRIDGEVRAIFLQRVPDVDLGTGR